MTAIWLVKVGDPVVATELNVGRLCVIVPTLRVKLNVPMSPFGSLVVPDAVYEPGTSAPLVAMRPVALTVRAGVPLVWT